MLARLLYFSVLPQSDSFPVLFALVYATVGPSQSPLPNVFCLSLSLAPIFRPLSLYD